MGESNNGRQKYKYLLKNMGFLTIGQFGTKLLSFLLVPLYTNILTTTEYGTYDIFITTVSLLIPILTLNVGDAIAVYLLKKENDVSSVFLTGLKYTIIGSLFAFIVSLIIKLTNIISAFNRYWYYLPIMFALSAINTDVTEMARGLEKVKNVAIGGVICSLTMIVANILGLVFFKLGLNGYFIATILGNLSQIIYIFDSCRLWRYIRSNHDKDTEKDMLKYSTPLVANSIGWWVNNSSDKYIVTGICGIVENGVYSVSYKIPSILNTVSGIFAQAWAISAIKEFDPEDSNGFASTMYGLYNFILTFTCSFIIVTDKLFSYFLYAKDFYVAWKYVPFLTISVIFGGLSGFLGCFFSAVKDTKIFAISTLVSAVVNTLFNFVLVYFIGTMGAAIATMLSYYVTWLIRYKQIFKYIKMKINIVRDYFGYAILLLQTIILLLCENNLVMYFLQFICLLVLIVLFRNEIIKMVTKANGVIFRRIGK